MVHREIYTAGSAGLGSGVLAGATIVVAPYVSVSFIALVRQGTLRP